MSYPLRIFGCATLVLAACATGPDYQRPVVEVPESKSSAAKQNIRVDWWNLFGDNQLQIFIQEALKNNQDMAVAIARLDEARALAGVAKADYYPTLNATGSFGETQYSAVGSTPLGLANRTTTINQLGLQANYELDFWGKVRRSNESARARLFESEYTHTNVQLQISSLVAQNYINVRSLDAKLLIAQDTFKSRTESYELMTKRFQGGLSSELDARQAEADMWEAKGQVSQFEEQLNIAESTLALLMGRSPKAIMQSPLARGRELSAFLVPPALPETLSSQILERRPDILAAEQNLVAENARIGIAKSYYFPSISLFGGIGTDAREIDNLFKGDSATWSYGINIFMPIFNAGKIGFYVEAATARQKQAVAQYQKSIQVAFTEVRNATKSFEKQGEYLDSSQSEVTALSRNVYLAKLRYRNGQSPYLEVLDAERRLFQSELNRVSAEQGRLTAVVDIYRALGGGWVTAAKD